MNLRPLALGEILDRATTLCVRNIVPLILIYAAFMIPLQIAHSYSGLSSTAVFQAVVDALQHPSPGKAPDVLTATSRALQGHGNNTWLLVADFLDFVVGPLPGAAMMAALSAFYLGTATSFGAAYRVSFARWLHLLGVNLLYLLSLAIGAIFAVVLAAGATLIVTFLLHSLHAVAIFVAIAAGIIAAVAGGAVLMVGSLAWQLSLFTCIVERAGFVTSFVRGLGRTFGETGRRRALLAGFAYFGIYVGVWIVWVIGAGLIVGLLRAPIVATTFGMVMDFVGTAFITAFVGVYYYDLRVREEGLDLQMAALSAMPEALPVA